MKQNTVKVKERYNWPVTILLIIGIVLVILLPLYMALMIAIKDPTDMNNILALPRKIRLQNFADAWVMTNFPRKFLNTAFITVVNLIFTLITNSFAAYAITRNRFFHVLPNSLLTVVTMLGMSFGGLLGGTMIVETVFSWNGIGSAAVAAISGRDYQLIQGYVMWMGCIYVLVNLLVDISYQWLDPRIRRGALQHEE